MNPIECDLGNRSGSAGILPALSGTLPDSTDVEGQDQLSGIREDRRQHAGDCGRMPALP
jgi:hypothetical protein